MDNTITLCIITRASVDHTSDCSVIHVVKLCSQYTKLTRMQSMQQYNFGNDWGRG